MSTTGWREKDDRTITGIRSYLERERLDVFIPSKTAHIAYLTNYYDSLHMNILWDEVLAVLVIPRESDAFIVGVDAHYAGHADDGVAPWWLGERHSAYGRGVEVLDATVALLKEKGLGSGRIGIERKWMPVAIHDHLRSSLPDAEYVSADALVPQLRFIKTPREQMLLGKAAEAGLRSMEAYMEAIRSGATVRAAERVRAQRCLEYGAEWCGGPYRVAWTGGIDMTPAWWDREARERFVAAAHNRNWLGLPDETPFFVTHFETRFQYYYCDLAWHELYGAEPDENDVLDFGQRSVSYHDAREDFEAIRRVQSEALQGIRPGMDQHQARRAVDEYLSASAGATEHVPGYFIHGVGLEVHEEPVISSMMGAAQDEPIQYQPGAVVSSEWFSRFWTVEEPFLMTEAGWEPLVELKGIVDPSAAGSA